jgi:hypothetical protein
MSAASRARILVVDAHVEMAWLRADQLLAFGASGCYSLDTPIERLKPAFFAPGET